MEVTTQNSREAFDFSQNAQMFKKRLWMQLKECMAAQTVQELEDDDLEWVSAAGMPYQPPEEENVKR